MASVVEEVRRKRAATALSLDDVMLAFKRARGGRGGGEVRRGRCCSPLVKRPCVDEEDGATVACKRPRRHDEEVEALLAERLELAGVIESAMVDRHVEQRTKEAMDELELRFSAQLQELKATVADQGRCLEEQQERLDEQQAKLDRQAELLEQKTVDLENREMRHREEVQRLQATQAWQRHRAQTEYESLLHTMQRAESEARCGVVWARWS